MEASFTAVGIGLGLLPPVWVDDVEGVVAREAVLRAAAVVAATDDEDDVDDDVDIDDDGADEANKEA